MSSWKGLERRVCQALGGQRRGPTGREMSDCDETVPFAVECKRTKKHLMREDWLEQAKRQGRDEGKPWLLVVHRHNEKDAYAVMRFSTLLEVLRAEEEEA